MTIWAPGIAVLIDSGPVLEIPNVTDIAAAVRNCPTALVSPVPLELLNVVGVSYLESRGRNRVHTTVREVLRIHVDVKVGTGRQGVYVRNSDCLLYTSPSPRDRTRSRMPSSA